MNFFQPLLQEWKHKPLHKGREIHTARKTSLRIVSFSFILFLIRTHRLLFPRPPPSLPLISPPVLRSHFGLAVWMGATAYEKKADHEPTDRTYMPSSWASNRPHSGRFLWVMQSGASLQNRTKSSGAVHPLSIWLWRKRDSRWRVDWARSVPFQQSGRTVLHSRLPHYLTSSARNYTWDLGAVEERLTSTEETKERLQRTTNLLPERNNPVKVTGLYGFTPSQLLIRDCFSSWTQSRRLAPSSSMSMSRIGQAWALIIGVPLPVLMCIYQVTSHTTCKEIQGDAQEN